VSAASRSAAAAGARPPTRPRGWSAWPARRDLAGAWLTKLPVEEQKDRAAGLPGRAHCPPRTSRRESAGRAQIGEDSLHPSPVPRAAGASRPRHLSLREPGPRRLATKRPRFVAPPYPRLAAASDVLRAEGTSNRMLRLFDAGTRVLPSRDRCNRSYADTGSVSSDRASITARSQPVASAPASSIDWSAVS
jgi:hypothetical protein